MNIYSELRNKAFMAVYPEDSAEMPTQEQNMRYESELEKYISWYIFLKEHSFENKVELILACAHIGQFVSVKALKHVLLRAKKQNCDAAKMSLVANMFEQSVAKAKKSKQK